MSNTKAYKNRAIDYQGTFRVRFDNSKMDRAFSIFVEYSPNDHDEFLYLITEEKEFQDPYFSRYFGMTVDWDRKRHFEEIKKRSTSTNQYDLCNTLASMIGKSCSELKLFTSFVAWHGCEGGSFSYLWNFDYKTKQSWIVKEGGALIDVTEDEEVWSDHKNKITWNDIFEEVTRQSEMLYMLKYSNHSVWIQNMLAFGLFCSLAKKIEHTTNEIPIEVEKESEKQKLLNELRDIDPDLHRALTETDDTDAEEVKPAIDSKQSSVNDREHLWGSVIQTLNEEIKVKSYRDGDEYVIVLPENIHCRIPIANITFTHPITAPSGQAALKINLINDRFIVLTPDEFAFPVEQHGMIHVENLVPIASTSEIYQTITSLSQALRDSKIKNTDELAGMFYFVRALILSAKACGISAERYVSMLKNCLKGTEIEGIDSDDFDLKNASVSTEEKSEANLALNEFEASLIECVQRQDIAEINEVVEGHAGELGSVFLFWKVAGKAYREIGENHLAFKMFDTAIGIERNDIETLRLFSSTCYLLSKTEKFAEFVNTIVEQLDNETRDAFIDYIDASWVGYIQFGTSFSPDVLAHLTSRRQQRAAECESELMELGATSNHTPLKKLKLAAKSEKNHLIKHVINEYSEELKNLKQASELILRMLDSNKVDFQSLPEQYREIVLRLAAERQSD